MNAATPIIGAPTGEMSVAYNAYLGKYISLATTDTIVARTPVPRSSTRSTSCRARRPYLPAAYAALPARERGARARALPPAVAEVWEAVVWRLETMR